MLLRHASLLFHPQALAITISIYIIYSWAKISKGQVGRSGVRALFAPSRVLHDHAGNDHAVARSAISASHAPCCLRAWQCPTSCTTSQAPGLGLPGQAASVLSSISYHPVAEQSHASRHSQQIGVRRHLHPVSCHTSCLPKLRLRRFPAWAKQNMQSSIASPLAFSCSWPP